MNKICILISLFLFVILVAIYNSKSIIVKEDFEDKKSELELIDDDYYSECADNLAKGINPELDKFYKYDSEHNMLKMSNNKPDISSCNYIKSVDNYNNIVNMENKFIEDKEKERKLFEENQEKLEQELKDTQAKYNKINEESKITWEQISKPGEHKECNSGPGTGYKTLGPVSNLEECKKKCSENNDCKYINFMGGYRPKGCDMFTEKCNIASPGPDYYFGNHQIWKINRP